MAFVHERDRQVHFKVVYAGPARGGKTTNLLSLYARLPADKRGRLLSLAGPEERTLFFDFLPFHLGEVGGFDTRFHLYTVPGQARHRRSRQAVLRGADAVVFVVDSAPHRRAVRVFRQLTCRRQNARLPLLRNPCRFFGASQRRASVQ